MSTRARAGERKAATAGRTLRWSGEALESRPAPPPAARVPRLTCVLVTAGPRPSAPQARPAEGQVDRHGGQQAEVGLTVLCTPLGGPCGPLGPAVTPTVAASVCRGGLPGHRGGQPPSAAGPGCSPFPPSAVPLTLLHPVSKQHIYYPKEGGSRSVVSKSLWPHGL